MNLTGLLLCQTSRAQLNTATDTADFSRLFMDTKVILSDGSSVIYVCLIQMFAAYFAYIFGMIGHRSMEFRRDCHLLLLYQV